MSWTQPLPCPCCGYRTFSERASFEICPVCFWQDDGQDDANADDVLRGPNKGLSLTQARVNFQQFGACHRNWVKHVRAPRLEERKAIIHMFASARAQSDNLNDSIHVTDPGWSLVVEWLDRAYTNGGGVSFNFEREKEEWLRTLSMRSDRGRFLLMAATQSDEGDRVISWWELEGTLARGVIDIGGDDWDARSVLTDISLALHVFKEAFDTGGLSAETLGHMR
jgi:hypothetical protein